MKPLKLRPVTVWALIVLLFLSFVPAFVRAQSTRQLTQEDSKNSQQQKRIALVIGNGAYQNAAALPNPVNDATDVAATLKDLGFEVISGTNQTKAQMQNLIRQFGNRLADTKAVGLFFYAGHGLAQAGTNYLIPVDADIQAEDEIEESSISINFVLNKMAVANNGFNMVILDACRNNPFARKWRNYRDIGDKGGLTRMDAPTGTLIAYATKPGDVASDGTGRNGLYTGALLKQMRVKNLDVTKMFQRVRGDVMKLSGNKQVPFDESSLVGDFYFAGYDSSLSTSSNQNQSLNNAKTGEGTIEDASKNIDQSKNNIPDGQSVPNNTKLIAVLKTSISDKTSSAGDRFVIEVASPSQYEGAIIEGRITQKGTSASSSAGAWMWLEFDSIRLRDGRVYSFSGNVDQVRLTSGEKITVTNGDAVNNPKFSTLNRLIDNLDKTRAPVGTVVLLGTDSIDVASGAEFILTSVIRQQPNNK